MDFLAEGQTMRRTKICILMKWVHNSEGVGQSKQRSRSTSLFGDSYIHTVR
jgi:hypothetical protein